MLEYNRLTEKTGYIIMDRSLVVVTDISGRECILIDSGYSEAPELLDLLRSRGKRPAAVLCTHFHVDHMGNNGLLQRKAGAKIYAAALEIDVQRSRYESDEGSSFKWMDRDKYFFGESGRYKTKPVAPGQKEVRIGGRSFRVEELFGHSPAHLGFATPDGVLHVGDAIMTDRVLRHSKVPYELNITKTLDTLEKMKRLDYPLFAASHMGIIERRDIAGVIGANIDYHLGMLDYIESSLGSVWENMDLFIREIIESRGVNIKKSSNIGWIPSAVRSYIDHLVREGRIETRSRREPAERPEDVLSAYDMMVRRVRR